jgi:nitrogen fixation protein NifU and related proteins
MSDELYHQAIVALARDKSHAGHLESASGVATITNPLCGDRVTVEVAIDDNAINAVAHTVRGCVLCKAAAAAIGEAAPGLAPDDARRVADQVTAMLKASGAVPDGAWASLAAFSPVVDHKSRHDCVGLPFQALVAALDEAEGKT